MTYSSQQVLISSLNRTNNSLYNFLSNVDSALSSISAPSNILAIDMLITAPITISYTNPTAGEVLIVFLQQDGTGHTVNWGSNFRSTPTVSTTPHTYSAMIFLGRANNTWVLIATPILGGTP